MDYDLVVIGSGPGGYVAAIRAAQLGLKTLCIEKDKTFGGTCLNVGCIPSKALLHSSHLLEQMDKQGKENGITFDKLSCDLPQMMKRKEGIVGSFTKGISFLFQKNKVDTLQGIASFEDAHTLAVGDKKIKGKNFIIATGSVPISLPFLTLDEKDILSSTGALSIPDIPKHLLIIGAGIIGVELGSVWARLGAKVSVIELLPMITPSLDDDISKNLYKSLSSSMEFHLSYKVSDAKKEKGNIKIIAEKEGKPKTFTGDKVLVAIGRKPYTENLGLENIDVKTNKKGFISIDGFFRTKESHIFAIGDVVEGPMLAHKASDEGIAVAEFIAGKKPKVSYMAIPNVAYTHPEAASVGFTEKRLKELQIDYIAATVPFKANSRARCISETEGMVKILAKKKDKQLLGMHILSANASELIAEACIAMQKKLSVHDIVQTSHAHPTLSESIKEAAHKLLGEAIHS